LQYACFKICDKEFESCYNLCDNGNVECSRTCVDKYAACEELCPCSANCPNGCADADCQSSTFCNECSTAECLAFADIINSKLDESVDPCVDFDAFSCGGWKVENEIPPDSGSNTQFTVVRKALAETVKRELELESTEEYYGWEAVRKAKAFYALCMDEKTIDAESTMQLKQTVTDIEWPTLEHHTQFSGSVMNAITTAHATYALNLIFSANGGGDELDPQDASQWIISLGHPSLGMSQGYFTTDVDQDRLKYKTAYIRYITDFSKKYVKEYELSVDMDKIEQMAIKIYSFEYEIANRMWSKTENRDPANTQRKQKIENVTVNGVVGDWSEYLNEIFDKVHVPKHVDSDTFVNAADEKWFANVDSAIAAAKMSESDLKDYVAWRVHMALIPYLAADWRQIASDFDETISGTSSKQRWETCSDSTNSGFGFVWAVGKLYVEQDFADESRDTCVQMVAELKNAFRTQILSDADWMSSETKARAKEKLEKMVVNIGYPEFIGDEDELNAKYFTFNIEKDNYIQTGVNGRTWYMTEKWNVITKPVDKTSWYRLDRGPAVVNAWYSAKYNSITFPAGILQPPFFHKDMTTASNYGGIGMVIGHEITHGFDDQGSKYYVDGNLTAGENTADNGGLWEAAYALDKSIARSADKFVWGVSDKFTQDQLFYIGYGQIWCSLYRPEYAVWLVQNDPHSPDRFRINGAVQNADGFAKAFGCRKGSPMAPHQTCRVW